MKNINSSIVTICLLFIISFLAFHVIAVLNGYELNTNVISIYIDLLNAIIIIFLTVQVYLYNKNKDEIDFKSRTPIISIYQEEDYTGDYYIQNIGVAPAINIRVLSDFDEIKSIWKLNIIAYDLLGNKTFKLDPSNKLQYLVLYKDIYNKEYYSYMINNTLSFGEVNSKNTDKKIQKLLQYKRTKEIMCDFYPPSV